jgi:hypothetical protein
VVTAAAPFPVATTAVVPIGHGGDRNIDGPPAAPTGSPRIPFANRTFAAMSAEVMADRAALDEYFAAMVGGPADRRRKGNDVWEAGSP